MTEFRDPRFDPRCNGSKNFKHYVNSYSFIDQIRKGEIAELEMSLKKERDPEKRNQIKSTISRLRNKMAQFTSQREQPTKSAGKYLKKSDVKKRLIVKKFKELKESGKLNKYMERKRKKLINRDGKALR